MDEPWTLPPPHMCSEPRAQGTISNKVEKNHIMFDVKLKASVVHVNGLGLTLCV